MKGFIELTFAHGVKRLVALAAIRRVDKREGYEGAVVICEKGLQDLYPYETYDKILELIRDAQCSTSPSE